MAREYHISWTKGQLSKLNSAVRKYNNAIRRARKTTDPKLARFLPSEVKYQDVKAQIQSAHQLNNIANQLSRAARPHAMDIITTKDGFITRYERHEYAVLRSVRERRRAQEIRKKYFGFVDPMKNVERDTRPIENLSPKAIKRFIRTQTAAQYEPSFVKRERYINNYMKVIDTEFGGFQRFDSMNEQIKAWLSSLDDEEAMDKIIRNAPEIGFLYSGLERDMKAEVLYEYWSRVLAR